MLLKFSFDGDKSELLTIVDMENKHDDEQQFTVVVADDCKDNLMLIGLVLDSLKLEYYLTGDGKTALDLVHAKRPSLVLLDVVMPSMNGIEANISIKNDVSTKHIPTIAITGLAEQEHILAIENAGFNDYIIKPFMIDDLENRIKHFLEIS